MKQWFSGLTQREQLSLLVLGLALGLYLVYLLAVRPLGTAREEMAQRNSAVADSLQRVDVMVSQILALRESGARSDAPRNLTSLVNSSTAEQGLAVARLQPNSRGEVQVRLEDVSFDALAGWLYQLEYRENIVVQEVSITQGGGDGQVNATVRLGPPG
ncbi:type II secretion system protein GspM [Haliea sp. E17]|uniref:type II secretion system protein GspM n=1 Tax=Haliea sp. E17 TaxID=3401576 RepID=UPI003AAE1AFC